MRDRAHEGAGRRRARRRDVTGEGNRPDDGARGRVPRATHAARPARPLALPPLALPPRPPLARAGAATAAVLVRERAHAPADAAAARAAGDPGGVTGGRGRDLSLQARRVGGPAGVGACGPGSDAGRARAVLAAATLGAGARPRRRAVLGDRRRSAAARLPRAGRGPCPGSIISRAPGIARAVARPPEGDTSRSAVPWMTSVGARDAAQLGRAVAGGDDRGELAARARRVVVAVEALRGELADVVVVAQEARASRSRANTSHHVLDERLALARRRGAAGPGRCAAPAARCGGLPVLDMIETSERTELGWRAASVWAIMPPIEAPITCAGRQVELVEQPRGVVGHVGERVARRARGAQQQLRDRRRRARDVRRAPDVAVVEAHDVEAARGELRGRSPRARRSSACRGPSPAAPSGRTARRRSRSRG